MSFRSKKRDLFPSVLDEVIQRSASAAEERADAGPLATAGYPADAGPYRRGSRDAKDHIPCRMTSTRCDVSFAGDSDAATRIVGARRSSAAGIIRAAATRSGCGRRAVLVSVALAGFIAFLIAGRIRMAVR